MLTIIGFILFWVLVCVIVKGLINVIEWMLDRDDQ